MLNKSRVAFLPGLSKNLSAPPRVARWT